MEKLLKIKIAQRKYLYGKLRGSIKRSLVVFVHGMTGSMDGRLFYNGARYLEKRGLSSFRFNLYDWRKDTRKLEECTIAIHAHDLDVVVKYFRKRGIKKIFVVGHSYGGPTILSSRKKQFDAIVLWDPTSRFSWIYKRVRIIKSTGEYILSKEAGYKFILGSAMVRETRRADVKRLIKEIRCPIKLIFAGKGVYARISRKIYDAANSPKAYMLIRNAGHTFSEDGAEEKLFAETYRWFRRWV